MKTITPHIWFDKEAVEAAKFYTSVFPDSRITSQSQIHNTPSGDCDIVSFELSGHDFMAISAGPLFKINPSISFMVNFDPKNYSGDEEMAKQALQDIWTKISDGGKALMPLQEYPFSKLYGWTTDRYGVSWQLILTKPEGEERPFIVPSLMFTGKVVGKAEEATDFYMSIFNSSNFSKDDSKRGTVARYGKGSEPDKEGTLMYTDFTLGGKWFVAMDSAREHDFTFNEAVSLLIPCENQAELDYFTSKLSADPESEQCGWVKDKYGVSWQIWSTEIGEMMQNGTDKQVDAVTQAFLPMKRLDIAKIREAYNKA